MVGRADKEAYTYLFDPDPCHLTKRWYVFYVCLHFCCQICWNTIIEVTWHYHGCASGEACSSWRMPWTWSRFPTCRERHGYQRLWYELAERDMGIRGFGTIFGEQQTEDVGNAGIDLFFEMLFESLSKVCSGASSFIWLINRINCLWNLAFCLFFFQSLFCYFRPTS